ncbi:glycosyltransferase family 2 protein [Arthrobacter sp. ERGS1:01]|uniref:glycosyltransferase family 2 protein n=1 Tax=Arthrobacter sp. ERGS1:01 TaxID=1704044 RepID=UPI0009EA3CA5|nr:glycosyltransferase family 2 protein [Arthrobacter sp. ERGS1:01]
MTHLVVGVLTYKRPEPLGRALVRVLEHAAALARDNSGVTTEVLVVDNDPAGSARDMVRSLAAPGLRYVVEAEPGISAARNKALDEAASADILVYIDDDERPEELWLQPLLDTWRQTGAAAVMGRVVSEYESEPSPWVAAGTFFWRPRMPTGTVIAVAATGNLLLDMAQIRRSGVRFDPRLGLTGGEDSLFSRKLARRGYTLVWCDESVATDFVPAARLQRGWLLKRSWSHGNAATLVELMLARSPMSRAAVRVRAVVRGSIRIAAGAARNLAGRVTGSLRHQARGLRTAYHGAGMVAGGLGHVYKEYARHGDAGTGTGTAGGSGANAGPAGLGTAVPNPTVQNTSAQSTSAQNPAGSASEESA